MPKEKTKTSKKRQITKGTNNDSLLETNFQQSVIRKLVDYRNQKADYFTSIADYLASQHYQGKSQRQLSKELNVNRKTLSKIFQIYNLPKRPKAESIREMLGKRWKDKKFRKRQAKASRKKWEEEDFRKRNTEAARKAWKSYIEKDIGYRADLQRGTYSAEEANIERAIKRSGRDYEIRLLTRNSKVKEHKNHVRIYFLTTTPRGNQVAYLLIDKPSKKTFARKEELKSQGIRVRIANKRFYQTLERLMSDKIGNWE